jgi:hypothetical protein
MSPGFSTISFLAAVVVSLCLTCTRIPRKFPYFTSRPSMSRFRARNGVIKSVEILSGLVFSIRSNIGIIAASVFPLPVGAIISEFFPERIIGIPFSCGSVNESMPREASISLILGCRFSGTECIYIINNNNIKNKKKGISF